MPKEVFVGSEGAAWQTLEKDYYNYPLSGYSKNLRAKKNPGLLVSWVYYTKVYIYVLVQTLAFGLVALARGL